MKLSMVITDIRLNSNDSSVQLLDGNARQNGQLNHSVNSMKVLICWSMKELSLFYQFTMRIHKCI